MIAGIKMNSNSLYSDGIKPGPRCSMASQVSIYLAIFFTILLISCQTTESFQTFDVVIYGSTPAAITAAIQAKKMGNTVVLISPNNHLGGATTGGLTWTDYGRAETIGGLADECYARIKAYYDQENAWKFESRDAYPYYDEQERYISSFEPSVALMFFQKMLQESDVEVVYNQSIGSVVKEGVTVQALTSTTGQMYRGSIFIDATYEGDLMAKAGVRYHVGRESEAQYGEDLAGVLGDEENYPQPKKYFGKAVSPYDDEGRLLPGIQQVELGEPGSADGKIQAYNFRMCLSRHPNNQIPITKPAGYDPWTYELLARYIKTNPPRQLSDLLKVSRVPNLKTDINDGSPFSTDYIGANWEYPEGDSATRVAIFEDHTNFTKGLIYFIGHDERVPASIRAEMQQYGYAKDEFVNSSHWNPQLYVRETRRLIGEYVMTQHDCQQDTIKEHSVGIGSYGVDSHHIQRLVVNGEVFNEGNFLAEHHPYEIPYECLLPKREECANLLVPVCLSSSHIAFGSLRMEPVYMILGQSSAVAAAIALDEQIAVQDVPYPKLEAILLKYGQKLKL